MFQKRKSKVSNKNLVTRLSFTNLNASKVPFLAVFTLLLYCFDLAANAVDFDIVYVKQPRLGDNKHIRWPEAFDPVSVQPGSDLVLLKPDGSEEILVDTKYGAVTDPFISFDGNWVYYSYFPDLRPHRLNKQRNNLPLDGSDIYKMNLKTKQKVRLTFQEFTPNTASGNWQQDNPISPPPGHNYLGYGVMNLGPAPIAGGKIIFTSSRNGFTPTKNYTTLNLQLFVMDKDGKNVEEIAPMTLGSALHPTPLKDGRVIFSSYETQGLRDERLWGLWAIYPDGRNWEPIVSAFDHASVFHFMTQTSNEKLIFEDYYNKNNFGFGNLYSLPISNNQQAPKFHSANKWENPEIMHTYKGALRANKMSFTPKGLETLTPLSTSADWSATQDNGKYTHPSAAPNNQLLFAWSDGPVNKLKRPSPYPAVDSGIYLLKNTQVINNTKQQLVLIKNDPNYNEAWPRAVVPYKAIHDVDEPIELPWLPNSGTQNKHLPAGTPFGLIGTSSFYNRETKPGDGRSHKDNFGLYDAFNTSSNDQSGNWTLQGADAGRYDNADIWAVRILTMEPTTHKSYGPGSSNKTQAFFYNHANERLRILGEIPLRKFTKNGAAILDKTGVPDTSFMAKIPADVPFTFQTLDRNGSVLNMSQTWHQVRPGEIRTNCGGCHAHSQPAVAFKDTIAAKDNYKLWDLTQKTPLLTHTSHEDEPTTEYIDTAAVDVEFYRDIRPVLQQKCVSCHNKQQESEVNNLRFDDLTVNKRNFLPNDYARLCHDKNAQWGLPPLIKVGKKKQLVWRQTNASRYIRMFQSRRSLLTWTIFGKRLDGWSNEDHPTELTPGDINTLPAGATPNQADLDFNDNLMPPLNSPTGPLTELEKLTFVRWIDLGCPIDTAKNTERDGYGWFLDETRPTLTLSSPIAGKQSSPLTTISLGITDYYSGLNMNSLSVKVNFIIGEAQPFTELNKKFVEVSPGVFEFKLGQPIDTIGDGSIIVSIEDKQGNIKEIKRHFSINQ